MPFQWQVWSISNVPFWYYHAILIWSLSPTRYHLISMLFWYIVHFLLAILILMLFWYNTVHFLLAILILMLFWYTVHFLLAILISIAFPTCNLDIQAILTLSPFHTCYFDINAILILCYSESISYLLFWYWGWHLGAGFLLWDHDGRRVDCDNMLQPPRSV